jgi:hypothetical protein
MRKRWTWAVLFAATALSGGCVTLCRSTPEGIPVRRLPDEVLHACPSGCQPGGETVVSANKPAVKRVSAEVPIAEEAAVPGPVAAPGCCGGVFYTGGGLGSCAYPLTPDLRVTDAIAMARGPVLAGKCRRVTIIRRLPNCQQFAIRVNLKDALCDPRENIPIWPNDMILTPGGSFSFACPNFQQPSCCDMR